MRYVKLCVELLTSTTVHLVVGNVIKATTPKDLSRLNRLGVGIGGFIIGSMISDLAIDYVNAQIDDIVNQLQATEITPKETVAQPEVLPEEELGK